MAHTFRALVAAGALATNTLIPVPALAAAPAPAPIPSAFASSSVQPLGSGYDCWGRCGWGNDRRWRRDRVDTGDVLIGAAIIGGLAAIISSENRRKREREAEERNAYVPEPREQPRSTPASGLESAANMCTDRIEQERRVEAIENVARTAAGWQVTGLTTDGASFVCRIGNGGGIESVEYGADGQWSDSAYAAARASVGGTVPIAQGNAFVPPPQGDARMPAYPGGPIPGEEIPEDAPN